MRKPGFFRPKLRRRGASDSVAGSPSWWNHYRRDPGGALVVANTGNDDTTNLTYTPLYPWGLMQRGALGEVMYAGSQLGSFLGGGLANALYAMPMVLPAGAVIRLVYSCLGNTPASGNIRMGIYTSSGDNLYPTSLVHDSGAITYTTLGPKSAGATSIALDGGLYWGVLTCDTDATGGGTTTGSSAYNNLFYPVLGVTVRWGNGEPSYNQSGGIGWRHAQAFGALPATFPSSAPSRIVSRDGGDRLPLIFFGFDPD